MNSILYSPTLQCGTGSHADPGFRVYGKPIEAKSPHFSWDVFLDRPCPGRPSPAPRSPLYVIFGDYKKRTAVHARSIAAFLRHPTMRSFAPISAAILSFPAVLANATTSRDCKTFPGDAHWPEDWEWNVLNDTVGGNLIKTVPLGAPCHDPGFENATCEYLQSQWQLPGVHMNSSSSVMAPFFANQSCDPWQPESRPCDLGNYVSYSVKARDEWDITTVVLFARLHDIRLVIRNTGHDYNGRSTGAGSLAVWTHGMMDIEVLGNYSDSYYTGKAMKVGPGVQGFDVMEAAHAAGLVVVGGECPSVGLAGGYTQGGGHSALSTNFGLSADNVLEFGVVTALGLHLKATKSENTDLYYAVAGGGGGNWGVVTYVTVKAFEEKATSGASLTFYVSDTIEDDFYAGIQAFHEELADMVDAGTMVIYYFTSTFFMISVLTGFDKTEEEVKDILVPFTARLDDLNITYTSDYSSHDSYYEHYDNYFGPLPLGNIGVGIAQYGGRLIPRSVAGNISDTLRFVAEQGVTWIGVGTDVSGFAPDDQNAVLPTWRDALVHATLTTPWDFEAPWEDMIALQDLMTDTIIPALEAVTPGSGAYMNEADFRQPNWQEVFFGDKYDKLLGIKKKYDPTGFFYALKGVGSEDWEVRNDGRLCKV
ncbi:FAD-binding domain-containing protein [Zalerion maritima]|uniref:FAD-binding domain-containing protein n=1 Tax=Zalerion maritima TaxID=339359 RepID=A0AAD5RJE6_9PEZI|nr:FAD-binding domain-containing protein [Zalerion maritima]